MAVTKKTTSKKTATRKPKKTVKNAAKAATKKRILTPNFITGIRIALAFVWLALFEFFIEPPAVATLSGLTATHFATFSVPILCFTIAFVAIALTDLIDGFFARKQNAVSKLGIFLDPIADKILVLCGLLVLMQYGYVNIWAVVIIVSREFLVGGLRMAVAEQGIVIAANGLGKAKTCLTFASIIAFFIYMILPPLFLGAIVVFWIAQILLMFAIFFTIWSGLEYYAQNKRYL